MTGRAELASEQGASESPFCFPMSLCCFEETFLRKAASSEKVQAVLYNE